MVRGRILSPLGGHVEVTKFAAALMREISARGLSAFVLRGDEGDENLMREMNCAAVAFRSAPTHGELQCAIFLIFAAVAPVCMWRALHGTFGSAGTCGDLRSAQGS